MVGNTTSDNGPQNPARRKFLKNLGRFTVGTAALLNGFSAMGQLERIASKQALSPPQSQWIYDSPVAEVYNPVKGIKEDSYVRVEDLGDKYRIEVYDVNAGGKRLDPLLEMKVEKTDRVYRTGNDLTDRLSANEVEIAQEIANGLSGVRTPDKDSIYFDNLGKKYKIREELLEEGADTSGLRLLSVKIFNKYKPDETLVKSEFGDESTDLMEMAETATREKYFTKYAAYADNILTEIIQNKLTKPDPRFIPDN